MDNVRRYLADHDPAVPLYVGHQHDRRGPDAVSPYDFAAQPFAGQYAFGALRTL